MAKVGGIVLGGALLVAAVVGEGCSSHASTAGPTTSSTAAPATVESTTTATATTPTVSCPRATRGGDEDGTIGPLFCSNGQDNPSALAYYEAPAWNPTMLRLPAGATRAQVLAAMCNDLKANMSVPTEQQAYQLAARRDSWSYGLKVVTADSRCS